MKFNLKKAAVVFDFDDTLVWSEKMKKSLFRKIFPYVKLSLPLMKAGDRYQIIRGILEYKNKNFEKLYDLEYLKKIGICKKRKFAVKILKFLNSQKISIFINSATPQKILRSAVCKVFPRVKFKGVFGGFAKKRKNLKWIKKRYRVLYFVGDTAADKQIADAEGVPFLHACEMGDIPSQLLAK